MVDLSKIRGAARHIDAGWTVHDTARSRPGVERRIRARHVRKRVAAGSGVTLALALVFTLTVRPTAPTPPGRSALVQPTDPAVKTSLYGVARQALSDGAEVVGLSSSTDFTVVEREAAVEVKIAQGGARFDVPSSRSPKRPYVVRARGVEVHVVGTRFSVDIEGDGAVVVEVEHGRVRVVSGVEARSVGAWSKVRVAADGRMDELRVAPPEVGEEENGTSDASVSHPKDRRERRRSTDWRGLARHGNSAAAVRGLGESEAQLTELDDLLLAADALRRVGARDRAVRVLGRAIALHPKNPRVALAMFTRARLLEETNLRSAALAYAEVGVHPHAGALAEDALAREAEAWARLADERRARARAQSYLQRYPGGAHAERMRALAVRP